MRRTIFLALLAALLLAPTAFAAGPDEVIRDCADDGALQGDYTPSELRKARNELPTDIDEYSDCRDVLSRAIAGAASDSGSGSGGSGSGGGGTDGGNGGPTSTPTLPSEQSDSTKLGDSSSDAGKLPAPYSPSDHAAVKQAATEGAKPVDLDGQKVAPGVRLAAEVGRNDIPGSLIAVLALLGAAAIAIAAPVVRRRVIARRQP